MADHNTFCTLPFTAMKVHLNGTLTVCCQQDWQDFNFYFDQYPDWRDQKLLDLKRDLINGVRNPLCTRCWELEDQGVTSYRQRWNKEYKDHPSFNLKPGDAIESYDFKFLHLDFDSFCNLKCIMCHPTVSSSIAAEYHLNTEKFLPFYGQVNTNIQKWHESPQFEDFLNKITNLETLILTGGEPLINPTILRLLKSLPTLNNINLVITTNATVVKDEIFDLLNQAKSTAIVVSVEGVGFHNDYIRHGSSWNELDLNIKKLSTLSNSRWAPITINHVLQYTSIYTLESVIKYAVDNQYELNINKVTNPEWLSIAGVPTEQRNQLIDKLNALFDQIKTYPNYSLIKPWIDSAITELGQTPYDPEIEKKFWSYIETIDGIRGTSFQKTFLMVDKV